MIATAGGKAEWDAGENLVIAGAERVGCAGIASDAASAVSQGLVDDDEDECVLRRSWS